MDYSTFDTSPVRTNRQKWMSDHYGQIPLPFIGAEDGSWTAYSIRTRLPEIGRRVIQENHYPPQLEMRLINLFDEIPSAAIKAFPAGSSGDIDLWNNVIEVQKNKNWLEVPWLFVEFYFYRRILDAVDYFKHGGFAGRDPYEYQKLEGFRSSLVPVASLLELLENGNLGAQSLENTLKRLLHMVLLGNQVDLSLWPHSNRPADDRNEFPLKMDQLIVNDLDPFLTWFFEKKKTRIDFFIDNAGFELLCDLCLVDFLLVQNLVEQFVLHVKPYPIFVSDAMEEDVKESIQRLSQVEQNSHMQRFAQRLENAIRSNRMILSSRSFLGMPGAMWEMPDELYQDLSSSDLIISKGDANYRRILGDRHWAIEQPFSEIVSYMPCPLLCIRVLKSELGVGYDPERIPSIKEADSRWMQNGKWGSFQFWDGRSKNL